MGRAVRERAYVEAAPVARGDVIGFAVLAVPTFTLMVAFTGHWLTTLLTGLVVAALWSATVIWLSARLRRLPPPRCLAPGQIPPGAAPRAVLLRNFSVYVVVYAAVVIWSVLAHPQFDAAAGIVLGGPAVVWDQLRRIRRTEREMGGTLWVPAQLTWTRSRARYLTPSARPGGGSD